MSNLVETYLAQSKSFFHAGDLARGIELLEKARKLSESDPNQLAAVLAELSNAYEWAGKREESEQCADELRALVPPAMPAPLSMNPPRKSGTPIALLVTILIIVIASGSIIAIMARPREPVVVEGKSTLLHDNVGMLVVIGQYAGMVNSNHLVIDVPFSYGTCFAISSDGYLISNRHVIDLDLDASLPLPPQSGTLSLINHFYLACFGPDQADHLDAKLMSSSERLDLAVFKVDRKFDHPFKLAESPGKQGDEIFAAGYPGAVTGFLAAENSSDIELKEKVGRALNSDAGKVSLLDVLLDRSCFSAQLNRGIISATDRPIHGVSYTEFDAQVSQGNSGGPLLNSGFQVEGLVTLHVGSADEPSGHNNFAISSEELRTALSTMLPGKL